MAVITISGQFGAGGPAIGKRLAERLDLEYVDKQIIHKIALDLKVPEEEVAEFDEARYQGLRGFLSTVFDFNALKRTGGEVQAEEDTTYDERDEIPFDYRVQGWIDKDIYQQMVARVITALGERGKAVIKGRGSQWILREFPGVIHLRFIGDLEDRVRSTMERRGLDEARARKMVNEMDKRGADFVRGAFGCDLTDPTLYHLVINTSRFPADSCVNLLEGAVKELAPG